MIPSPIDSSGGRHAALCTAGHRVRQRYSHWRWWRCWEPRSRLQSHPWPGGGEGSHRQRRGARPGEVLTLPRGRHRRREPESGRAALPYALQPLSDRGSGRVRWRKASSPAIRICRSSCSVRMTSTPSSPIWSRSRRRRPKRTRLRRPTSKRPLQTSAAPSGHISQSRAASISSGAKCSTSQSHEGRYQARPEIMRAGARHDGDAVEVLEVLQAEFHVMPQGGGVHALEIGDHLEHAHLTVALDEGFELARHSVELIGRDAAAQGDLDGLGVVVFRVREHGGPVRQARFGKAFSAPAS